MPQAEEALVGVAVAHATFALVSTMTLRNAVPPGLRVTVLLQKVAMRGGNAI